MNENTELNTQKPNKEEIQNSDMIEICKKIDEFCQKISEMKANLSKTKNLN